MRSSFAREDTELSALVFNSSDPTYAMELGTLAKNLYRCA